ncbi:MFS general substrate transporter [Gloeopeniophorella convolvens]|nr:MFS general substrate transporter [Gloeopeniophorella convolvens]
MKWKGRLQMTALCWTMFLLGWNDGSVGPLLPRIQQVYHVDFFIVSLIFVANCLGIISGGLLNVYLAHKLGFGKVLPVTGTNYCTGSALATGAYCIQAPAPPFPVFVISYFVNGLSMALQDAHVNGYVASFKHSSSKLGIVHSVYGLGAFAAPLLATHFAQLPRWSFQYLVSIGIGLINTALLAAVFRFKTQDECMAEIGETPEEQETNQGNHYSQIFRRKTIHLIAMFILAYVGVEVTIGGWIVSYTIDVRGGGPSSGYISSGFFGGLALGRVALLWVNKKVRRSSLHIPKLPRDSSPQLGNRRAVSLYMFLAIILELVVWLVPSLISGAVAISLIGLVLGPIYPIAINETGKILPRWLITGAIGWIGAFGTTGSAAVPFATGVLAQEKGIWTLQPLLVSMMAVMVGLWFIIPRERERLD